MSEENYWLRRARSGRFGRRHFVGGAAATGLGAAAIGLVGCGDDDDEPAATATTGTGASPAASTAASPSAAATTAVTKGGIARFSSANNTWDTFDIDRSRFTPFAVLMGFTNEGFVQYSSFGKGTLEGAFAEKYEQPDTQTLNLTLRKGLTWQNKAPVNGRAATVDDMLQFVKRNKEGKLRDGTEDINFYRKAEFANVASFSAVDANTLQVKFTKPDPFFLGTLASAYAKIQAPEAITAFEKDYANLKQELIVGTGPYQLTKFTAEGNLSWRKSDKFSRNVNIDGIDWFPLFADNAALQAAFEQKQIDEYGPRTKAVLDDLLSRYKGKIYDNPNFSANPMAGTYYGGSKPWSDQNLIGAIFRSIDRRVLIQQMFQGRAALAGNIPPTQSAFGITEKELITYPGYIEDRAKDLAEAKKMWEAGGGPALGEIIVDIPDIWEGAYSGVSALVTGMLKTALGNTFTAKIEPYSTITGKLIKQQYGNGANNIWYGWISDVTKLEPSLDLYNAYNSASPQNFQFGVKVAAIDDLTNKVLVEPDLEKRKAICKQIEIELIKNYGAGIPYNMVNINNVLRHNYYHGTESQPFVTAHQFGNLAYLDSKDPTFADRKA